MEGQFLVWQRPFQTQVCSYRTAYNWTRTVRSVQAHTSATADDNSAGWQELAPQLANQPMQIDLFAAGSNACLLTNLGSNAALPAGNYQQIRLLLVANSGGSGPTPGTNNCNGQGFNCVVLHDGSTQNRFFCYLNYAWNSASSGCQLNSNPSSLLRFAS